MPRDELERQTVWNWTPLEAEELDGKFKRGLLRALQVYRKFADQSKVPPAELRERAGELEKAGKCLDECAANCHALASTFRVLSGQNPPAPTDSQAQRLRGAEGSPVVLTRTTIDKLKDQTLVLEDIQGNNAVVRLGNEYWGTPVDRLLVVSPNGHEVPASGAKNGKNGKKNGEAAPPLSPVAAAFVKRLEIGRLEYPLVIQSSHREGLVRMVHERSKMDEFVEVEALPDYLRHCLEPDGRAVRFAPAVPPPAAGDFIFRMRKGELGNALQFLTMAGRKGVFVLLDDHGAEVGRMYSTGNRIVHAVFGEYVGVEAVARLLRVDVLEGVFTEGEETDRATVTKSTDQLLIEAAVMADELGERRKK